MREQNIIVDEGSLMLLLNRLDKDKDGRVSYQEVLLLQPILL